MKHSLVRLLLLPLLALPPTFACSSDGSDDDGDDDGDGAGAGDCAGILAGDLVITEVMANPLGEDPGSEYFEIYNASSSRIDLAGLTLVQSLPDGSSERTHRVGELSIEPAAYLALGTAEPDALPDFIDYGFGNDLGSLRNAGSLLALRCGDTEVDRIEYPSAEGTDGVAWGLDGAIVPDYIANDDIANFCEATVEFATDMRGSPGAPNEDCNPVATRTCTEGGSERELVVPVPGDLVITEFMASPAGADDDEEWFEVYAARDVDLNGLIAGREPGTAELTIEESECLHLEAGSYALFARSGNAAANGGLPAVTQTFDFALVPDRFLFIGVGDQVLDQIGMTPVVANASTALDPAVLDPDDNDDPASWSACAAAYGAGGNTGTPGASNSSCAGVAEDTCLDGGTLRPIVAPEPGQIRITEAMADPAGADDLQEWFEVEALADFDLKGLGFNEDASDEVTFTISGSDCFSVATGDLLLFARSADPSANGGLPQVDQTFPFGLNNDNGRLFVSRGGLLLDVFAYGNAAAGRARQLDPETRAICNATTPYPTPAGPPLGTPAAPNVPCPAP